eukprot:TRINITY_DN1963_c1_g1_i1.p1 TRINITY_DN1963_c1_g1~~TRINITY_DN1963_c1_g1_i1.p1  ORF type:complete len:294 (+),score=31.84 TRINITY_DN1963_c1_g1_i1:48-884(+)
MVEFNSSLPQMLPMSPATVQQQQVSNFSTPDDMPQFRVLDEGLRSLSPNTQKIEATKQFWKEHVSSMHTGRVSECYEAWMTGDVVWLTERVGLPLRSQGITEACKLYNIVQDKILGGPQSTVTTRVNRVVHHQKTDLIKLDFVCSILKPNSLSPKVEFRRFTIRWNEDLLITRVIVSPTDDSIINPVLEPMVARPESGIQLEARPCSHNNWDPVRVKRKHATLRCRTCTSQWKLHVAKVSRCAAHITPKGCPDGSECSLLHINARKLTYEERTGVRMA